MKLFRVIAESQTPKSEVNATEVVPTAALLAKKPAIVLLYAGPDGMCVAASQRRVPPRPPR